MLDASLLLATKDLYRQSIPYVRLAVDKPRITTRITTRIALRLRWMSGFKRQRCEHAWLETAQASVTQLQHGCGEKS